MRTKGEVTNRHLPSMLSMVKKDVTRTLFAFYVLTL